MSLEEVQQNYADATGFVVDRTTNPPKILGQAFLISRSRAVTCSSVVYNYAEAAWALSINFPHPDVTVGVKSIVIHPDFDKKAARTWYLGQTGNPGEQLVLMNDIATLTLPMDYQLPELQHERVAELNRALSLPVATGSVEASGSIRGEQFLSIINDLLQAQRSGLLTLLDGRNLPIARIQLGQGMIQKVYFKQLLGELGFFELVYRKPAEGYMFQTESQFNWGNVRDIAAGPDALVEEALRRAKELPNALGQIGGTEARYQQRIENYDPNLANEQVRWFAERLWTAVDGYMTVDKLSERVGADTYTVLQAMREMVNKGQISMIHRSSPYHANGVLGQPLISHTDFEVNAWDPLQSFYLDPLSGRPVWQQGNFFGVANALQPKNMLHTIALPAAVPGALILKDYKLIGIHSGPHTPRPGQPIPPVRVYQMMWMGALLELTPKKLREEQSATGDQQQVAGLRSLEGEVDKTATPPDKLEKFVCPSCHATNTQVGPCFNCGTVIEPPPPEPEVKQTPLVVLKKLQEKYNVTNRQLAVAGGIIGVVALMPMMCSSPPPPSSTAVTEVAQQKISDKTMHTITDEAGFKGTALPGYRFIETTDTTKPLRSFGMESESSNQKLLFLIMDDMAPVQNLSSFVALPPYTDNIYRPEELITSKVEENYQLLGDGQLHWYANRYPQQKATGPGKGTEVILVGAYPSPLPGKSVLLIGRALKPGTSYDYKSALWLCDQMAADFTVRGNEKRKQLAHVSTPENENNNTEQQRPIATDEQLDEFAKKVEAAVQSKLKFPDEIQEQLTKKKTKKDVNATMNVHINDNDGSILRLEFAREPAIEAVGRSLEAAIEHAAPFEDPPHTKSEKIEVIIKLDIDKIKVTRPI